MVELKDPEELLTSRKVVFPYQISTQHLPTALMTDRTNSEGFVKVALRDAIEVSFVPEFDDDVRSASLKSSKLEIVDAETMLLHVTFDDNDFLGPKDLVRITFW